MDAPYDSGDALTILGFVSLAFSSLLRLLYLCYCYCEQFGYGFGFAAFMMFDLCG
jgi:hypothetical protein